MAISFELLHPSGFLTLQSWTFETESVIRIGREPETNHVVVDSHLVSRLHAMICGFDRDWKIVNLSCNGTYLDNKPITHALLTNGAIIRLSSDGPKIRFRTSSRNATNPLKRILTRETATLDSREVMKPPVSQPIDPLVDQMLVNPKGEGLQPEALRQWHDRPTSYTTSNFFTAAI